MASALSSTDVTAIVSRSLQQLDRVKARAGDHQRRTSELMRDESSSSTSPSTPSAMPSSPLPSSSSTSNTSNANNSSPTQQQQQQQQQQQTIATAATAAEQAAAREEVAERVNRITQRSSEFVQVLANEPSVGLYHVHEHVLRSLPKWNELQSGLEEHTATLERHRLDVDYSIGVVGQIVELQSFAGLAALSRRSLQLAEQLRAAPRSKPSSTAN